MLYLFCTEQFTPAHPGPCPPPFPHPCSHRSVFYVCESVSVFVCKNKNYNEVSPHTGQNGHHKEKSANNKCWWRYGEKRTLLHCWWGCKLVQSLWRTVWRFLTNLNIELPYHLVLEIPLRGIDLEKTIIQKDICTPVFIAASFTVARTRQQPKCPSTEEWIKNTCTAMNTRVKASLWVTVLPGYMPRSGTAGSYSELLKFLMFFWQ